MSGKEGGLIEEAGNETSSGAGVGSDAPAITSLAYDNTDAGGGAEA